jgi:hypothetical protein
MEKAMTSRRLANEQRTNIRRIDPNGGMAGVGTGLAALFAAAMAIGIAIGYMSV